MSAVQQYASCAELLARARLEDLRAFGDRSGTLREVLRKSTVLPEPLVAAVLADDGEWVAELLRNHKALLEDERLRRRLAASGHPDFARLVVREDGGYRGLPELLGLPGLRALFAAADPADRRWTAPGGAVASLLAQRRSGRWHSRDIRWQAALASPFPPLVRGALHGLVPPSVTRLELLGALLTLVTHGGPGLLAETLGQSEVRATLGEELTQLGREAADGAAGLAKLRAAVEDAASTGGLVQALRAGRAGGSQMPFLTAGKKVVHPETTSDDAANSFALWPCVDWAPVRDSHRTEPFEASAVELLVQRPDCTDEVLAALLPAHPKPLELLRKLELPLPRPALAVLSPTGSGSALPAVLQRSLGTSLTGADLLDAPSAVGVLSQLRQPTSDGAAEAERRAFHAALAQLVAERLGGSVPAWREVHRRLPRFRGSVGALLADAARRAGAAREEKTTGAGGRTAAPEADGFTVPPLLVQPSLRPAEHAFLTLLEAASANVRGTLLEHLDDLVRFQLLTQGDWEPEWLDRALAEGRRDELLLLSRRRDLPPGAVEKLAALDDPEINAGLLYAHQATWEQRHALLTGTPFAPGRTERLPLDAAAVQAVKDATPVRVKDRKAKVLPWVGCGDLGMVQHCLGIQMNSQCVQLHLLLGVWERHGPEQVREHLMDWFDGKVRTLVKDLLAEPDQQAALQQLRDAVREKLAAKELARRLRAQASLHRPVEWLLAEGYPLDWEGLLAEHRRKPLPAERVTELSRMAGCPPEFRARETAGTSRTTERALKSLADGRPAAEVLARVSLTTLGRGPVARALDQQLVTGAELVRHARPAPEVLHAIRTDDTGDKELAALVHEHLEGRADAWTLALRMLDDFAGTLPELLQTAVLATGESHGESH